MKHNVVTPSVGESITEVTLLKWNKNNGDAVKTGDVILEIESEKATVEVIAEANGALTILKPQGEKVRIGEVVASIDDSVAGNASAGAKAASTAPTPPPVPKSSPSPAPSVSAAAGASAGGRQVVTDRGFDVQQQLSGTLRDASGGVSPAPRTTPSSGGTSAPSAGPQLKDGPGDRRVKMSRIRSRIAERLVHAQHTAAILTTFNEVDMKAVMDLRNQYKDSFKSKNGVPLSFMSFFTRACCEALKLIPGVNASIDGEDIVYHDYQDVGIAVGTDRGLVVPVIRNAGEKNFLELEQELGRLAVKARDGKLSIAEMTGGTFTISNGGTYGSMMSTPILNPPQSGILGMHKIMDRPMAVNGKIELRPMMYLALSYDHRLIDGKEAVTFLVHVKDFIENPEKLNPEFTRG